jgi:hypothetical protein
MRVVGPLVAADSESNLLAFRFVGASRAASAMSRDMSLGLVGGLAAAASNTAMHSPCAIGDSFGDNAAPPGLRHRRCASELA